MIQINPPTRGSTTAELLLKIDLANNPVTKAVLRQALGNRIDEAREGKKEDGNG